MSYTVWLCCGNFECYNTKRECLGMAVAAMNSDYHSLVAVEGPNGEDLMAEAEELDSQRTQEWLKREQPKPIGDIIVQGPSDGIKGIDPVYSENDRARHMARYTTIFGASRVRWVPRSK